MNELITMTVITNNNVSIKIPLVRNSRTPPIKQMTMVKVIVQIFRTLSQQSLNNSLKRIVHNRTGRPGKQQEKSMNLNNVKRGMRTHLLSINRFGKVPTKKLLKTKSMQSIIGTKQARRKDSPRITIYYPCLVARRLL